MVLIAGCLGLRVSEIVALQWRDFDFRTDAADSAERRSRQGGRREDRVLAGYRSARSGACRALMLHKDRAFSTPEGWLFANPRHGQAVPPGEIQKKHIRKPACGRDRRRYRLAHVPAQLPFVAGSTPGAPITVQKELMRHASIQTTMNVYGKAMTDSKRQAHSKVVEMVLDSSKSDEIVDAEEAGQLLLGVNGSFWFARIIRVTC